MHWLTRSWWKYVLECPRDIFKIICRVRGHCNPIWYTLIGAEPDMRCSNCLDYIG